MKVVVCDGVLVPKPRVEVVREGQLETMQKQKALGFGKCGRRSSSVGVLAWTL